MGTENLERLGRIVAFLWDNNIKVTTTNINVLQRKFIEHLNCRPLVGVRVDTGGFTADTYIYRKEKSSDGAPHWERIFSPFSYNTYEEALEQSLIQSIDNL